jgi:hypothetical protein
MRLWTLHPKYLDGKGLVALWREALLAQTVLRGETRGYRQHPQLVRFRESGAPEDAISCYLTCVHAEAVRRGYAFDFSKIISSSWDGKLPATEGQLEYEWGRLREKLRERAPDWLAKLEDVASPEPHPLFVMVPGPVEPWESLVTE